jgi:signal peptidase I
LKRCMGIAGDTLQVKDRVVFINDQRAPIPKNMKFNSYRLVPPGVADERIFPPTTRFNEDNYGPIVIPKKGMTLHLTPETYPMWEVFIAREGHKPALRADGQVIIDDKPVNTYTVERDYLFGMGDNRDNSLDSRYWGFIPEENVVGTPMFVYWSWNSDTPIANIVEKIASIRLSRIGTLIN